MSTSSSAIKRFVTIGCLAASALALYNVYSDVGPVQGLAAETACGAEGCAQLIAMERTPISQTFTFQVQSNSSRTERVVCRKSLLLVGKYACERGH